MEALFWGFLSAFSLIIGAILALKFKFRAKILGLIMAFGVGALISSVSFELVSESFALANGFFVVAIGIFSGALVYFFGDFLIDKFGGKYRKSSLGKFTENTENLRENKNVISLAQRFGTNSEAEKSQFANSDSSTAKSDKSDFSALNDNFNSENSQKNLAENSQNLSKTYHKTYQKI